MDSAEIIFKYFPQLNEQQRERFMRLGEIYADWNAKINLISRKDIEFFYERHVLHSLGIVKFISFAPGASVMDAGTGGGFPGIPLSIFFPQVNFLLVDSVGKKLIAVRDVIDKLGLENVDIRNERIEKISEKFDFIVSRALMSLPEFEKFVRGKFQSPNKNSIKNGIIYLKGGDFHEELNQIHGNWKIHELIDDFDLPFFETKKVVYLEMGSSPLPRTLLPQSI